MRLKTHLAIDTDFCGQVTRLEEGRAELWLHTSERMKADERGLIHGGFIFGAADYAAMAAVNDPNVVLGAAEVKFLAPVKKGESVFFVAEVRRHKGKRREVAVSAEVEGRRVFEGTFQTFVLPGHVLDL